MKAASINEIKKELSDKSDSELQALCMRLARYKKENKELLTYLLYESYDEASYVNSIKADLDEQFDGLPSGNVYFIKKGLRKILRSANKQIKYSGNVQSELELRIYFCSHITRRHLPLGSSQQLANLYAQQLKKIDTCLAKLPEDLRFDYADDIEQLRKF